MLADYVLSQPGGKMSESSTDNEQLQPVEFIPFNEFKNGLPFGRFRVIVNPKLAQKYMKQRLFIVGTALGLIVFGLGMAFSGATWFGGGLVVIGVALNRIVKTQAPKMLLHLATRNPDVYHEVLDKEIMEVRRA
jgi:hypothetical protein